MMDLYHLLNRYSIKSKTIKQINLYNADKEYETSYKSLLSVNKNLGEDVMKFKYNKKTKELDIILWT